jgi:hypothetical protein
MANAGNTIGCLGALAQTTTTSASSRDHNNTRKAQSQQLWQAYTSKRAVTGVYITIRPALLQGPRGHRLAPRVARHARHLLIMSPQVYRDHTEGRLACIPELT